MGFLTTIMFDNDGKVVARGTSTYDTIDSAEIQFHVALSSAMSKSEYGKVIALVFDEEGRILFKRVWERME